MACCADKCGPSAYSWTTWMILIVLGVAGVMLLGTGLAVFGTIKADTQYAVVMDLGSSGSRVYVYEWPATLSPRDVRSAPDDRRLKIEPGASSFGVDDGPEAFNAYFEPLLEFATSHVPASAVSTTPVYAFATAGMRLLPKANQTKILGWISTLIEESDFMERDGDVRIISGQEEGGFLWLATNSVLDVFVNSGFDPDVIRYTNVGALDLGGASTQIAFLPNDDEVVLPDGYKLHFHFEGYALDVYVASYLGLGRNEAIATQEAMLPPVVDGAGDGVGDGLSGNFTNPCFPSGYEEVIDGARYIGTSNYTECVATITPLINVTAPCKWETCGMRGYYMPDIITAPPSSRWFAADNYRKIVSFLNLNVTTATPKKIIKGATKLCNTPASEFKAITGEKLDSDTATMCFLGAYVGQIFTEGYDFPPKYKINFNDDFHENKVSWTLGALMYTEFDQDLGNGPRPLLWLSYEVGRPVFVVIMVTMSASLLGTLAGICLCARNLRASRAARGTSSSLAKANYIRI